MRTLFLITFICLLMAGFLLLLSDLFDQPTRPVNSEPEPRIAFIDHADLQFGGSEACIVHKKALNSLLDAPQPCMTDDDCSPLTHQGRAVNQQNHEQFIQLNIKTKEKCPFEQSMWIDMPADPYTRPVVSCINQTCQKSHLALTQKLVNDSLQDIKKP